MNLYVILEVRRKNQMRNFAIECFIMLFMLVFLSIVTVKAYNDYSQRLENFDKEVRQNCEELCTSLSLTIEDYYKCCNDCYSWESKK